MWQTAVDCVDRQRGELEDLERAAPKIGSLRVDPNFKVPRYLAAGDVHMMPGGYYYDPAGDEQSIRQGAVFDKAASLYSLGRQGGQMNDMRGNTVVAHLFEDLPGPAAEEDPRDGLHGRQQPGRGVAGLPDAECSGLDVGASLLRYARARAAHLGAALNFVQASAEEPASPTTASTSSIRARCCTRPATRRCRASWPSASAC